MTERTTADFGFEDVPRDEKARRVRQVFESVAGRYDLMNDLMSAGLHRAWKRLALERTGLRPGGSALDVAGGTGDLATGLAARVGPRGRVCLCDINEPMLAEGRRRLIDRGLIGDISLVCADAEQLPFRDRSFDCVTIAFGLRNITDRMAALVSMRRVLKPGGRLLVLEFSKPMSRLLETLYDAYSFRVLPALGELVAGDAASYRYLVESIRRHPDQQTLCGMMESAGLEDCRWDNLNGGIVALHSGFVY